VGLAGGPKEISGHRGSTWRCGAGRNAACLLGLGRYVTLGKIGRAKFSGNSLCQILESEEPFKPFESIPSVRAPTEEKKYKDQ
jgi:hypothetical protein